GGLRRGQDAGRVLRTLVDRPQRLIPPSYWSVQPDSAHPDGSRIRFRGAVLIRVRDRAIAASELDKQPVAEKLTELSHDLVTAVQEPRHGPLRELTRRVRADGTLTPALLVWSILLGAGAVLIEALLFRGFLEICSVLGVAQHRLAALFVLLVFVAALLVLDFA